MPQLTQDQKDAVARWASEGASLNDIQSRLKEEFALGMTYFDTRLLVMELNVKILDKRAESPEPPPATAPEATDDSEAAVDEAEVSAEDTQDDEWAPPQPDTASGNVSVALDQIAIPGAMVSGKATFSDGKTVSWQLDQYGRLGLRDAEPGYQPPPADIPAFQDELRKLLR